MKRSNLRRFFLLFAICCFAFACVGCSGFDSLTTTILAILGSINVVLATIQATIPSPIVAAIEAADSIAQAAVNALKTAYDNYIKDKTGTGLLAAVQAAIQAVQQSLAQLLAAAHVDNAGLQALITKVVNLISTVIQEVITDIVPSIVPAMTAHAAGNDAPAVNLNEKMKAMAAKLKADHAAILDSSELPAEAIVAAHKYIASKTAHHVGPIRV